MSTKLRPQTVKNRKNIGIELRRTHYNLGNDGKYLFILELMWVWNDYLLPYLVLDRTKFMTIPILVQYLKGSYGTVDLGATMAVIMMSIIPIIIVYIFCQKHIIKGVAAGAVKG